ncbi:tobamovirus multiplication protein 2A-like isoform X2 [Phoenix dactylifera]|uniref:Tobamovirus multiplication protein 2A-like isoform X2 n=1 Tax=Phoenix dactylifera TaxID=42345 RepID=A0A8B8J4H4_PHODC|nr:tobamovirus multiplication protein 2A-like isoform X2 [Phoenix dactylifera]
MKLPRFIYLFIGIGVILFIISCCGCVGATTRNGCCLSWYSFLVILLILVELAAAAFIFFDHSWKDAIPADKTGDFDMIYNFLKENWKIAKWVALGAVILEALAFLLALMIRAVNQPADYDSDDEYIAPKSAIHQPLINRQGLPPSGVPSLDHRPSRNDAWSQRMREKYGLDTSEFTYNPSDPSRFQQATVTSAEESGRCTIL